MDDFNKGFFDEFLGGIFADSPAMALILVVVVAVIAFVLYARLKDK